MADDVTILGLKELGDTINMLTELVQKRVIRNAARAGGRVYRDGMKSRAPVASGALRDAITTKDFVMRKTGGFDVMIGVKYSKKVAASSRRQGEAPASQDPAVYAKFLEFGRPGAGGHTNQAKQPFIRPTFDADTKKAEDAVAERIKSELSRYLA